MKKSMRRLTALLLVCVLSICLLAGCGTKTDGGTTTAPDATSTTLAGSAPSDSPATSKQSSGNTTQPNKPNNPNTPNVPEVPADEPAVIYNIAVGGVSLSNFNAATKNYTYPLPVGATAAPEVTAEKTSGTGTVQITQAANANGVAKVSLNGVTYSIQFSARSMGDVLNNTYYKLKTAKKLNVAYFGGSVTDGHGSSSRTNCWRSLMTSWLKAQFGGANITETNAGIGGTGSIYGAHRVIQDLKLTDSSAKPDLVFIEFASNDRYDKYVNTTPDVYVESIIQTIYKYAPQADIVMVLITDFNTKDTDFEEKVAHQKVANAYGIPYVDVGARLWKEIVKENGGVAPKSTSDAAWKKYVSDSVHPNDKGYAKYAQYIAEFLTNVFKGKTVPSGTVNAYKPAKTLNQLPIAPHIDNFKGETPLNNRVTIDDNGYLRCKQPGAIANFTFTGTELMFWIYGSSDEPSNGEFSVKIDGGKWQYVSFNATNHRIVKIASGLANKEHTVEVKLASSSTSSSNVQLRYVLINGNTQMKGITVN